MLFALLFILVLLPFFIALFFWLRHVHVDSDPMSWEDGRRALYKKLNKEHFTVRHHSATLLQCEKGIYAIL